MTQRDLISYVDALHEPKEKLNKLRHLIFKQNEAASVLLTESYYELFDKKEKGLNNYCDLIIDNVRNLNNVSSAWKPAIDVNKMVSYVLRNSEISEAGTSIIKIPNEARRLAQSAKFQLLQTIPTIKKDNKDAPIPKASITYNEPISFNSKSKFSFKDMKEKHLSTTNNYHDNNGGMLSWGVTNDQDRTAATKHHHLKRIHENESSKCHSSDEMMVQNKMAKPLNNNFGQEIDAGQNEYDNQFKTAKEQLLINAHKSNQNNNSPQFSALYYGTNKKSLGTRRTVRNEFVPPISGNNNSKNSNRNDYSPSGSYPSSSSSMCKTPFTSSPKVNEKSQFLMADESLKKFPAEMIESILSEVMDNNGKQFKWDDIAGLEFAKRQLYEMIVCPMLRPELFKGIRQPPKGLLLFGPPGTGKTLIGKCIASQSKSTFFSISASSLTSKWVGEGEKMVRALFTIARLQQPAVIFIDEIDSLLSQRSETEHESSRRIKTEFLVQWDGLNTEENDRLLLVGATNRPQEIDEAARRRFIKRLYIPLPCGKARNEIIQNMLSGQSSSLTDIEIESIVQKSDGYSGADVANLCREAALGPIRDLPFNQIENITENDIRPIEFKDFESALRLVPSSVSQDDLDKFLTWNKKYGTFSDVV